MWIHQIWIKFNRFSVEICQLLMNFVWNWRIWIDFDTISVENPMNSRDYRWKWWNSLFSIGICHFFWLKRGNSMWIHRIWTEIHWISSKFSRFWWISFEMGRIWIDFDTISTIDNSFSIENQMNVVQLMYTDVVVVVSDVGSVVVWFLAASPNVWTSTTRAPTARPTSDATATSESTRE